MSTGSTTTRENTTLSSRSQSPSQAKSKTVTSGIKSALTTFFQKRKEPDYVIGMFGEGRPKLEPGIDGVVIPVFDDQPSTNPSLNVSGKKLNGTRQQMVMIT